MRKQLVPFAFTLTSLLIGAPLLGQSASPLIGTWKLNNAKSKYDPGPPPKTQTIKWEQAEGGFRFTADGVNSQGQPTHSETLEKDDGTEATVEGAAAPTTRVFKRIDDRTYEDADKVNGKPTVTRRLVVSPDGKTVTITVGGTNAQGQVVNNVVVYDKQ